MASNMNEVVIQFPTRTIELRRLNDTITFWEDVIRSSAKLSELLREVHRWRVKLVHAQYRERRRKRW